MVIRSDKVILTSFTLDDVESFYKIAHDPIVKQYVPGAYAETFESAYETLSYYTDGDCINDFYLAIRNPKDNCIVGALIAIRLFPFVLDVSSFICLSYRGQGFGFNSLKAFIGYLKKDTSYRSLVFSVKPDNYVAHAVLQKFGLKAIDEHGEYFEYFIRRN